MSMRCQSDKQSLGGKRQSRAQLSFTPVKVQAQSEQLRSLLLQLGEQCWVTMPMSIGPQHWLERRRVNDLIDPELSYGQCAIAAFNIARWLSANNYDAWVPKAPCGYDPSAALFGYNSLAKGMFDTHYWVCLIFEDCCLGLDFTASQYGITDLFPVIQIGDKNSRWAQRELKSGLCLPQVENQREIAS